MMYALNLCCLDCGEVLPMKYAYKCPKCEGALDVVYDYRRLMEVEDHASLFKNVGPGLSRYAPLLPLKAPEEMITLGEGGTQLLPLKNIHISEKMPKIYLKNESSNATGSFKDRPLSISASRAKEAGLGTLVIASSGNAGAAAAAYAARGGLRCVVLVPAKTPVAKVAQTLAYGAQVVRVNGSFSDCYQLAMHTSQTPGCANVTTTYINPFNLEGDKTVAFEIFTQLGSIAPDYIFVPIGAGPLLAGIYKGFQELRTLGLCNKIPAMVGVQAEGCAPIVKAFDAGKKMAEAWGEARTVASAIADPLHGYERDATYTLNPIRKSMGKAVAVSDDEILDAGSELARCEGLFLEPTAATTLAATRRLTREGWLHEDDIVVLVLTGHGLKDPGNSASQQVESLVIEPSLQQLEKILL
jgi:threonine synthase